MKQIISNNPCNKDGIFTFAAGDYQHLRTVRRVKIGDMLVVCDNNGSVFNTTICGIDDKARIIKAQIANNGNGCTQKNNLTLTGDNKICIVNNFVNYYLFQCVTKPQTFEIITQKATECGVLQIVPVISEYTQNQNVNSLHSINKIKRLDKIIKESRQQSGSNILTTVTDFINICDVNKVINEKCSNECLKIVLWERSDNTLGIKRLLEKIRTTFLQNTTDTNTNFIKHFDCAILIGSEGGLSQSEVDLLVSGGFYPLHFNTNILRAQTAVTYTLGAIQNIIEIAV